MPRVILHNNNFYFLQNVYIEDPNFTNKKQNIKIVDILTTNNLLGFFFRECESLQL